LKSGKDWEIQESFCTLGDEQDFINNVRGPAEKGLKTQ
jgi:hypothetical protein